MAVVKGANAPLLQKTILHQLEVEKKALGKGRERNVVSGGHLSTWQAPQCAHIEPLPSEEAFMSSSCQEHRACSSPRQ